MTVQPPGLDPRRMAKLMSNMVESCQLNLTGRVVLTEAASGPYVVTPILAAMAGAERVYGLTRDTRYGTIQQIAAETMQVAAVLGVQDRIEVISDKSGRIISQADIVTNSGHVRPIDQSMIAWMKPGAVVSLMYEAWEYRPEDVDLEECIRRGVLVAGVNEQHPNVDVFSFLGMMAVKLMHDAGVAVYRSSVLVLCDNPFAPFLVRGLTHAGAEVDSYPSLPVAKSSQVYDVLLVALRPGEQTVLSAQDAKEIARCWPGAVVAQFWGDIDRSALAEANVPFWPIQGPPPGHMGVLPSEIGPEPIVRLQAGGLKAAEILSRHNIEIGNEDTSYLQWTR